jgi:hypothetical protein
MLVKRPLDLHGIRLLHQKIKSGVYWGLQHLGLKLHTQIRRNGWTYEVPNKTVKQRYVYISTESNRTTR